MLRRLGIEVTILTGRWHNTWPAASICREVRLVRILPAPKTAWTETLFLRNVGAWIVKHRNEFDGIYVDEAGALIHQIGSRSVRGELPLIARFAGIPAAMGDGLNGLSLISQSTEGCCKADYVVVPNAVANRQLQSTGFAAERIFRIPDVVWNPVHRSVELRRAAAQALKKINHDMSIPADFKLLLYVGDLEPRANLEALIRAAISELDRDRRFRLWLVGDGSELRRLYELVKDAAFHRDILFHGPFDNLEELLHVADGVICPDGGTGQEWVMPSAIASGIPLMALDTSPFRSTMPSPLLPSLLAGSTQPNFERAIGDWDENWVAWNERAEIARQQWVASNFIENARSLWRGLMERLSPA